MEVQASRDLVAVGSCLAFAKPTLGSDGRLCDRLHLVLTLETLYVPLTYISVRRGTQARHEVTRCTLRGTPKSEP